MEPGAYARLDALGLPRPRSWCPDELTRLPAGLDWVFVRAPPGHPARGLRNPATLGQGSLLLGDDAGEIAIDEVVVASAGCALATGRDDDCYIEFVYGHTASLLASSELIARCLLRRDGAGHPRLDRGGYRTQSTMVTIAGGEMATGPLEPAVRSRLPRFALLTRLREYVGKIPALTLAEVVYTSEGTPVLVDIRTSRGRSTTDRSSNPVGTRSTEGTGGECRIRARSAWTGSPTSARAASCTSTGGRSSPTS